MSKTIKFADGKTYDFTDSSTTLDCVTVVKTFAELDAIRAEFTEGNMRGAEFDGTKVQHLAPVSVHAETDGQNVVAHFANRVKGQDEINAEQISELQQAFAEIVGGNA